MALAYSQAIAALLMLAAAPALAQQAPGAAPTAEAGREAVDPSLSPECRVPGSKLYTLAPLKGVKRALRQNRAIRVLALGSSSTVGIGASSPQASYPIRLEGELQKLFPGVEVEVVNRGLSGEVAAGAAERLRNTIAEVEPDLVVWQVGTNDALARVDVDAFAQSLDESIRWIQSHKIDVVLIDPQYTASLAKDDYYGQVVKTVQEVARKDRVPLVLRYEAMRYLASQKAGGSYLARDQFHLNDLGYRCMAEHVGRAIAVALLESEPATTNTVSPPTSAAAAK